MTCPIIAKPGQISLSLQQRQAPEIDSVLKQQVEREERHS
jgi:hypothetical protein